MTDRPSEPDSRSGAITNLGHKLLVPFGLALAVFIALALVSDYRELSKQMRLFDWSLMPAVLGLSLVNYGLRFWRWQLYLRELAVDLSWCSSLGVFLVGFLLSVTPGKTGELGKGWLVRELGGGKARNGVAAVLAERVTDIVGVLFLIALSAAFSLAPMWLAVGAGAMGAVVVLLVSWHRAAHWVIDFLERFPRLARFGEVLRNVYDSLHVLATGRALWVGLLLSIVAWGAEGVGFVIVARSYQPDYSWALGVFNYSVSTFAGALSMLPGGLGVAEGLLTALMGLQGMETAVAASITLLVRGATLWFAVLIGALALPFVVRRLRRRSSDTSHQSTP